MIVCVDVDYRAAEVVAACVVLRDWGDGVALRESVTRLPGPPVDYAPGEFYRRELPPVRAALDALAAAPHLIVIDGYVWLGPERAGLGAHLHASLGGAVPVVGVAKRPFAGATTAIAVLRGTSHNPLFVTAVGIEGAVAADAVRTMHGANRIPTMLRRVDRLARDAPRG